MEDDNSNDVEAVEYIDSHDEEDPDGSEKRPIMLLLRRLIRNKQNTVMTNAQIIDILQCEFNISVRTSHELEVDIYIKIIKKYLKDWPQWEELERISTKLSNIKDFEAITKVLNHKYKNLKEYLGIMLEAAKPIAKEAIKNLTLTPEKEKNDEKNENIDSGNVVMEIQCTKEQLDHLFFRRPRLDLNNTIFNMSDAAPSRISLKTLTMEQIISVCCVKLYINLQHFVFIREVVYKLKHVLVNKVLSDTHGPSDISLITNTQMMDLHNTRKVEKEIRNRDGLIKQFNDILEELHPNLQLYTDLRSVFDILISEINYIIPDGTIYKLPTKYRRYANKYKYVRYLYAENDSNDDPKYDLQLEETVAPMYLYCICKMEQIDKPIPEISEWLTIECIFCKMQLTSYSCLREVLEAHFNNVHGHEIDWQCTHCKRSFSIDYLADNKWCHEC